MAVFVRTYATIDPPSADRAFYARAIVREDVVDASGQPTGRWREGFSVGFYAPSVDEATATAKAWIEAERIRQTEILEGRAAVGLRRKSA